MSLKRKQLAEELKEMFETALQQVVAVKKIQVDQEGCSNEELGFHCQSHLLAIGDLGL